MGSTQPCTIYLHLLSKRRLVLELFHIDYTIPCTIYLHFLTKRSLNWHYFIWSINLLQLTFTCLIKDGYIGIVLCGVYSTLDNIFAFSNYETQLCLVYLHLLNKRWRDCDYYIWSIIYRIQFTCISSLKYGYIDIISYCIYM